MLMATETITLVQRVSEDDGEQYKLTVISGVSFYGKTVTVPTEKGAKPQNTYQVRIPADRMPEGITPKPGDFVVHGVALEVTAAPRDLQGYEYFAVTAVSDNRRGRLAHWAVRGA